MTDKKIKFQRHERYDAVRAEKGVEHTIMRHGKNYGTFKTSLFDPTTKLTRLAIQVYQETHGQDERAKSENSPIFALVMACVHDWSGINDEEGNPVPFTKDNAFDYLTMDVDTDSWLPEELMKRSSDDTYYQRVGDPRASKKQAAGN